MADAKDELRHQVRRLRDAVAQDYAERAATAASFTLKVHRDGELRDPRRSPRRCSR